MTDKQEIIIDGVDVSGCEKYPLNNKWHGSIIFCKGGCNAYPNCEYKQLQRKTQECEELKRNNKILCDLYKNVDSCLQKLTEKFDCYRKALDEIEEICKCNYHTPTLEEKELAEDILDIINKAGGNGYEIL